MIKSSAIIFLLSFSLHSVTQAEEYNPKNLDGNISFVITHGLWEKGKQYGHYRLVVKNIGWGHTRSFIYLQWLHLNQEKEITEIISSIPITEFNTEDWRNFISASFVKNKFILKYENRGRNTPQKATLIPGIPGKYKINIKHEEF